MKVRFLENFDWDPPETKGRVTLAYKAGQERTVRRLCGEAAIAAGKAVRVAKEADDGSAEDGSGSPA